MDFSHCSTKYVGEKENEQAMMDELINTLGQEIKHKLKYLTATISQYETIFQPHRRLLNVIIGTTNKIARAKVNGHWFLDEHDMAC